MAEQRVKLFSNAFMTGAFALVNFVLVLLLMWTVGSEYAPEWKKYQREFYRLLADRVDDPALKQKILSTPLEIKQVWNPKLEIIDRCPTCHMGVANPKMQDVPQPFKVHPDFTQHKFHEIGCTVCHEGQGSATTTHAAHVMDNLEGRYGPFDEQHIGWSRPLLPLEYVQASCQKCHNVMEAPIPGADRLNAGWQLVQEKGCKTCHYVVDSGAKQAPELSNAGGKFFNESGYSAAFHSVRFGYLKESMRCPQANVDPASAKNCQATLAAIPAPAAGATLSGGELFAKYQCNNCHTVDNPNNILGPSLYDIGKRQERDYIRESILEPDKVIAAGFPKGVMKATLSGVGFYKDIQQTPGIVDSLVQYLAGLKGVGAQAAGAQQESQAAPAVVMPNFNLSDEELRNVVIFLLGLQEHTVQWPQKSFAEQTASGGQAAGLMFAGKSAEDLVKLAGCNACHKFDGPERLVGPSLWDIGERKDKAYIRESILEPDKDIVPGYPPGVMKATMVGTGFYQNISVESLEKMVEYLASLKGKP
jgi:cytochrome c2